MCFEVLAALGLSHVEVFREPRVAIISTGDELVDVGTSAAARPVCQAAGPAGR